MYRRVAATCQLADASDNGIDPLIPRDLCIREVAWICVGSWKGSVSVYGGNGVNLDISDG